MLVAKSAAGAVGWRTERGHSFWLRAKDLSAPKRRWEMVVVGTVESLWRYPVKSMRGEQVNTSFIGFSGVYGDRLFAFRSAGSPAGFPYLTGREQAELLRYRARFRKPALATLPPNLGEAERMAPGITPAYAAPDDLAVDVETPSGEVLAIDDPALIKRLRQGIAEKHVLSLVRSDRSFTDCRPISLISVQSVSQLGNELGVTLDKRRFRANVYVDLGAAKGFAENDLVGRKLRLGEKAVVAILELDPRCGMITLDLESGAANPAVLKKLADSHGGTAGLYAAVLVEGAVRPGDVIEQLS